MSRYRAVLFDWMLTLAHYPTDAEFVGAALRSMGRRAEDAFIEPAVEALRRARETPSVRERLQVEDTSVEMHRSVNMEVFELAGFDSDLAEAFYALLGDVELHPLYPDVASTLRTIHSSGVRIAVISDIHVDLREHAEQFGIGEAVDCWVLSFELGVQKPDPLMFMTAIDTMGVEPSEALMVGDRVSRDGAAARLGIDTLILPTNWAFAPRGLDRVARLLS